MSIFNKQKKITLYTSAAILVGLIIATLAWVYFAVIKPGSDDNQVADTSNTVTSPEVVCKDDMLKGADVAISGGDLVVMQRLAGEAKALPNYDKDPNCLYVILSERLGVSDAAASRGYFNDLEPLVRANNGFNQAFILSSPNLDTLRNAVSALESNKTQLDKQSEINNESFQDLDAVDEANSSGAE